MYLQDTTNDYGRQVSQFLCDSCGREFTVCPSMRPDQHDQWTGCLADECPSYDIGRDVDMIIAFGDGELHLESNDEPSEEKSA